MIEDVPSALVARRFERACGVPSMIQCAGMGAGSSSTSAGTAKTTGFGTDDTPGYCAAIKPRHCRRKRKFPESARADSRLTGRTVGRPARAERPVAPGRAAAARASGRRSALRALQIRTPFFVDAERAPPPAALPSPASSAVLGNSAISSPRRSASARARNTFGQRRRLVVEIIRAAWPDNLSRSPRKETRGVAAVFAQQRIGVVFRMALEEQKEAAVLLGENVDARGRRSGENFIAGRLERPLRQIVVARMRHA